MPLETANTIAELNANWPLGTDVKSQGDDHLRMIKDVMQKDAASLADGGTFVTAPQVPDGATAQEAINAADVDTKIAALPTVPVHQAFYDPTGAASWSITGRTLTIWGEVNVTSSPVTVTFPQPFVDTNFSIVGNIQEPSHSTKVVKTSNPTVTTCEIRVANESDSSSSGLVKWMAQGEWDEPPA